MKKIFILSLLTLAVFFGANVQAQYAGRLDDMDYKSAENYQELKVLLRLDGWTISTEQYAYLKQGESAYFYKTFQNALDYIIVGISDDNDVTDIDLHLYNSDGSEYDKDDTPDAAAEIWVSPYYTGQLRLTIKNAGSNTPHYASKCRFVIAYR